ncbi:GSCOCT00004112001.3-RA-CDS [Cotesia congregata]|uniref:Odorant receptor n=1 Tax=Cotesia congregata TaxID=51543 RepID=A0A8J2H7I9_COTCN|nr:GSCOCT00004112001.3-RA-CDS [Cotesia congregata]CAG5082324.1 olfactory receptor 96 [Cotesia congregata]
MDVFDSMHWKTTKKLLSVIGAWPFQPVSQRKALGALFYLIIQSIYIAEILKLFVVWGNLTDTLDCLPVFVYHSMVQVKMANCLFKIKQVKVMLLQIKRDWESDLYDHEIKILRDDARIHKVVMNFYSSGLSSVAVVYAAVPITPIFLDLILPLNETRQKILPYPTEYFVDTENNFYILYIHGFIVTLIALFYFLAFDLTYAGLVSHACSIFTIIGGRLKNLTSGTKAKDNSLKSLVVCIKMHKDILKFSELLEENYTNYFFLLLGNIVLGLTVTGFQLTVLATDIGDKIKCIWYGTGQVIHLFVLSYFGQKLINCSEYINESICESKWYNYSQKTKLLIILVLMRGKIITTLSAGKIYIMSIENFSSVMKSSMSFFTVLTSVQ